MVKSLNFGGLVWGKTPIVASRVFVRFSLFFGGSTQTGTRDFCRTKVLLMFSIAQTLNTLRLAV